MHFTFMAHKKTTLFLIEIHKISHLKGLQATKPDRSAALTCGCGIKIHYAVMAGTQIIIT